MEAVRVNAAKGKAIPIGRQGENLAREVVFDISGWMEQYGAGFAALATMRAEDEYPAPVAVEREGSTVTWRVSSTDTAMVGYGLCELRYYVGEVLVKAEQWVTYVVPALGDPDKVPDAAEDYIARMQRIGNAVQEAEKHAPRIGENGNWWLWDTAGGAYVDSGFSAHGLVGPQGPKGDKGDPGDANLALGIDEDDGLLYLYINGEKTGEGIEVGGPVGTRYTITYNLDTNMVSSNTATKIKEGNAYHAVISSSHVDYQVESIAVSMGGMNITSTAVDGNNIDIASVTGNITITVTALFFASVETRETYLKVSSGGTQTLGVKLHAQPSQTQTVSVHGDGVTVSSATLTFTEENWNTYQDVTITAGDVEETEYHYVTLTNSDPLLTESTVMVEVGELQYEDLVDTTIPTEGMHTVTLDDFTSTSVYGNYIRVYGYNAEYTNIKIPATLDGKTTWICGGTKPESASFIQNTNIQYVTFEDGVMVRPAGKTSGVVGENLFLSCSSLVGVSNLPVAVTQLTGAFKYCTALKFVDNLGELVNVTGMQNAFEGCTSLEYVQDLSALTGTGLEQTFRGCTSLKKIFGLPQPVSASTFAYAFMGTRVSSVTIPENASNLSYCFHQNTTVSSVTILADDLSSNDMANIFGSSQSQNITVYAHAGSTTLASLQTMFASSSRVTVSPLGGAPLPSIVVWGDSTSSPGRSWIEWPSRLQSKIGTSAYLVKNEAVSGEWTTSTAARQGGNALHVGAVELPADSTQTKITLTSEDGQTFSTAPIFSCGGSFNPCTISGIAGVISRSGADYYFTRLKDGNATQVADGTVAVSEKDGNFNAAGNIMLVNIGHNSGWNETAATLVNQMQLMVAHFVALGGTKYVVTGAWSGKWISTDSGWDVTQEVARLASTAFGEHWLDLPADMAAHAQEDNPGWTPTEDDLANISAGKTPMSLTYDGVHPTTYGANSQMMAFYRKGVALGYWNAST